MKKLILLITGVVTIQLSSAQTRYQDEIFTDAQITITQGVTYETNIDFLTSEFTDLGKVVQDLTELKGVGKPYAAKFYNPADTNTVVKVTDIKMDLYYPSSSADSERDRPLIIFVHTGNFLPKGINGATHGTRGDSALVELCKLAAKRGYVAASIDYRLGWNPISPDLWVRRGTIINAVYRALHDTKMAVRFLRGDATGDNNYGINPNQIILFGSGSGSYVVNAYTCLDKSSELRVTKLININTGKSVVDTAQVGSINGYGGLLNLYVDNGVSTEIHGAVTMGGAFPDTTWMEAGDVPIIGIQCVLDPFAPFTEGVVIVPTTGEDVVLAQGVNASIPKANRLGNNDLWESGTFNDPYTVAARNRYGKTYPRWGIPSSVKIAAEGENMVPLRRPLNNNRFQNEASPWQWWNTSDPMSNNDFISNPDMSPAKGRAYCDTIIHYIAPRIRARFGYVSVNDLNISSGIHLYPNPANTETMVTLEQGKIETVSILDATGREVIKIEDVGSNYLAVEISDLKSGLYFVQIYTKDGLGTARLLKE